MKVGIMTFHSSHNCGSMLQAYALQHTLEERYGADAELINFANQGSRNLSARKSRRFITRSIISNIIS